ncbi:hypothetical protein GCM10027020_30590 [Nocardioides salsibiostraticola]
MTPSRLSVRARTLAVSTLLITGVALTPLTLPAQAAEPTPSGASSIGVKALSVTFDGQDTSVRRGDQIKASGTVSTVKPAAVATIGDGVPAEFTLAVTDASGKVLGTQDITAAADGSFSTTIPGSVSRALPENGGAQTLALRAIEASYDDFSAQDAGAGAVVVRAATSGLEIENSFVSSVGWVKPGESYPSTVIVTNPTDAAITGATVQVSAPTGSTFVSANAPGTATVASPTSVTWTLPSVPAANGLTPGRVAMVLDSKAAKVSELATIVWRDLSTTATLTSGGTDTVTSHGPKVIPPAESYDAARYGDRPFPVVPVNYTDRTYVDGHDGGDLERIINDPAFEGSTFNLFQEMSLGQLFPNGTVPSLGQATADFSYEPGFDFTNFVPGGTCPAGVTLADVPGSIPNPINYPERITGGVYNLPGNTSYYGADANGSALVGALGGVAALQQIDSGCGPTGKLVFDTAAIADPEIDYSDFDTDKDGVVDFFMVVYAGCGGNGASQLGACSDAPGDTAPYDNIWPHSSSLEFTYTDETTGQTGYVSDDQLKDLEGRKLFYTDAKRRDMTTEVTEFPVFVRVGPYNVNPETAIDAASVISHEYGHSLGLPDFYSTGGRDTYGDWNLMATDKSQNMDAFARQELGWVVPQVLAPSATTNAKAMTDSKENTGTITWERPDGTPYTLTDGADGKVNNSLMYAAKLPGRQLIKPEKFDTGDKASKTHAWFSGSGNDFGCATDGGGHNLDFAIPAAKNLPAGSTIQLDFKSLWDIEWDYDYGFVLTSTDGGEEFTSNASENGYTTSLAGIPGNANQNGCFGAYDNGLTGTSGSYDAGTEAVDRVAGNTPESLFLSDTYDVSELVGADIPVLRFSYSTDPGLARPGWFIDDVSVTATTPSGEKILLDTDFETSGGPDDPFVFNGGCKADNPGGRCTKGWNYVAAGSEADFDHAYYLEMRDRSGFDLDGKGQIDGRGDIGWEAGLYLSYTDEAHGYGNAGTDDPPAQSPLDSTPTPGSASPNLNDAAFTAAAGRKSFSDAGEGHTDNYNDPAEGTTDPAYPNVANPWRFRYDCLDFTVDSMSGNANGPATSNGDLTGDVTFVTGAGCKAFDAGYEPEAEEPNTAPTAKAKATPTTVETGVDVTLSAVGSTDTETPNDLDYSWNFGDGDPVKDATGRDATASYATAGTYTATVTVTDPDGLNDSASVEVTVVEPTAGNTAPTAAATATPSSVTINEDVALSGADSTDVQTPGSLTYDWDFGDGGDASDASGRDVTTSYATPGTYTATVTVTDPGGLSDTDSVEIKVTATPTTEDTTPPRVKVTLSTKRTFTGETVTLSSLGTTDDTSDPRDLTYAWNLNDGGSSVDSTAAAFNTKFRQAGRQRITLTVTDEAGNSTTVRKRLKVLRYVTCNSGRVDRDGSWRKLRNKQARRTVFCDTQGRGRGQDVLTMNFRGNYLMMVRAKAKNGGQATVFIDGKRVRSLSMKKQGGGLTFNKRSAFRGFGGGNHTVRVVISGGQGFIEGFVVNQ